MLPNPQTHFETQLPLTLYLHPFIQTYNHLINNKHVRMRWLHVIFPFKILVSKYLDNKSIQREFK